jgi:hypothetical protein
MFARTWYDVGVFVHVLANVATLTTLWISWAHAIPGLVDYLRFDYCCHRFSSSK